MRRVSFYTLGCKLNYAETSTIARDFEEKAFEVVPFGDPADVTVINTCTVTSEADRKCRQVIRRAQKANPDAFLLVTGCYAQLQAGEIASIPGVDAVLGNGEKSRIFDVVQDFTRQDVTQVSVSCIDDVETFGPAFSTGERTRAFLKVQDGCDYSCAFCTIPRARGRSRSQTIDACIAQATDLAARGYREIVLSGVNIGLFSDGPADLFTLLQALDRVEGIDRYRISSIEPNLLTDAIIDFVAESARFQPHFHIPLQSGDDYVLGKMRRRYRRSLYEDRVARVRRQMPHACLGADVIVGFPAEDEPRFEITHRFLADLPLSYLHVFTYSERENTAARDPQSNLARTPVPPGERNRRNRVLRSLSMRKRRAFYAEHAGTRRDVLWEGVDADGLMRGFTDNYVRVQRRADEERAGRIERVRLGGFIAPDLLAADEDAPLTLPLL